MLPWFGILTFEYGAHGQNRGSPFSSGKEAGWRVPEAEENETLKSELQNFSIVEGTRLALSRWYHGHAGWLPIKVVSFCMSDTILTSSIIL